MKPALLYAYFLVVLLAAWYMHATRDAPDLEIVATKTLPKDHRLTGGDLEVSVGGDVFVARQVERGKPVGARQLAPAPGTKAVEGKVPVALSVEQVRVAAGAVNSGKALLVCPPGIGAVVRAVFCGDGDGRCLAVVDVAKGDLTALKGLSQPDLSLKQACE